MKDIPINYENCTWCPNKQYHEQICLKEIWIKPCDNKTIGIQLYEKVNGEWLCKEGLFCPKCSERLDK